MLGKMETDPARPKIQTVEVPPSNPPEDPVQDSTQPQVLVEGKKDYSKNFVFIIPAFLLVITVVLVGYGIDWYIGSRPKPTPAPIPIPTLVPATPTPTPEPIVEDKSYSNLDQGISFKYSENLSLLECENSIYLYNSNTFEGGDFNCNSQEGYAVLISFGRDNFYPVISESPDYKISESVIIVAGVSAVRQEMVSDKNGRYLIAATFSHNGNYFLIKIDKSEYGSEFNKLISSFSFDIARTSDWIEYTNSYYSLKYPPNWILAASENGSGISRISKNADEKKLQNLVIDFSANVANANLSASEVISSTRNLSGWKKLPSLDIRNIGGGTAQILQGQLDNDWHTFVVIWHKNRLVQIIWFDNLDRENQEVFDNILSSFKFAP
jgi:hypothetical protein